MGTPIQDYREAFPEYDNVSDEALARALYKKYGKGQEEFDFNLSLFGKGKRATPFEVGMAGLKSAGQTGIAALESKLGYEEAAQQNLKEAQARQEEVAGRYKREVPTAADIGLSPSRAARYMYETGAESLPYMIPPLAGGIVGGIVGGPVGAGIGATALNIPVFTATNIQRQIEEGKSLKDVDIGKAALTAIPQSAADALIGRYIPGLGKAGTGSLIRRFVARGIEGGVVGALTESGQQALEILQANPEKLTEFGPEVRRELIENAIAGGMLEGGLGAVAGAAGREEKKITPTTPPTEPVATPPTEPAAPTTAAPTEPTVSPPGEPVAVPPQGNEWLQQNAKAVEAFNEAPMEHQVVEPAAKAAPPKSGEVRMYFDPSVTEGNTGATAFFVNPKDLLAAKPEATVKYVDVPQGFNFAKSEPTSIASYVTDPTVDKDLIDKGQDYVTDEGKKLPVKFTSVVDKALYAVAKKTNPEQFNLAKDYLSKGLGMSEDEIDLKSREVSAKIDKELEDRKQAYGKGHAAPEASITIPRYSEEPSVATFPVEPRETIGGIDVNTTDPTEKAKLDEIIAKSPFKITDASKKALDAYAPGIVDLARDIHLKFFPGLKMNLQSGKGKTAVSRLFGSMNYGKMQQGEFTITVNTDAAYSPESALRTLFHEFSHVFEFTWFSDVPKDQLRAIIDQYVRETYPDAMRRMASYEIFKGIEESSMKASASQEDIISALTGKVEKTPKGKIVLKGSTKAAFDPNYHLGFSEWIAEKGANWYMNSDRVPRTALQKAFKNFYDGLRKIYYEISKYLGITPNQGAFEQLLSEIYGRKATTPIDYAGRYEQTARDAEGAARAAGVPLTKTVTEGRRRTGIIEDMLRQAETPEEARPGHTVMGDRIISKEHPLTEADIKETDSNPALLDPNIPPEIQAMGQFVAARKPKGFWSDLLSKIFGREEGESLSSAIIRNNVAAHLPFLQRADLREVGKTLERMQNAQGRMTGIIDSGHIVYDPKTGELAFESTINDREIGGLKKILAPVGLKDEGALQLYMIAKRELDLRARGRSGFGYVDPGTGKPFSTEQLKKIVDSAPKHIKDVGQNLYEFNQKMVRFSIDTGVIPKELGENLMSMFYTPFYRIQDSEIENNGNLTVAGPVGAALKNPGAITLFNQKLTSGGQIDANFYENTFRNYSSIVTAGLKNIAYGKAADALIKLKDPTIAQPAGMPGKNTITYRVAGGDKHLQINDPAMFQSLAAFSPKQLAGFVSAASKFANVLRTGVTTAPPFQIANMLRGLVDVYIKTGMPITSLASGTIRGFKDALMHGASARAIQAETGFGGFRYGASAASQAEGLKAHYALKEGTASLWQRATAALHKLENIGDASEMASRIAYYDYLIKKGMPPREAAWEAVNLTNFSRSGAGGGISGSLMANLIPMVPFLNARLQGLFRLVEHGTAGAPTSIIRSGAIGLPMAIVKRGLMLTMIELGLNAIYGDDDWYKKLSVANKINNNYIKVGDTIITIPRAFELGSAFGAIPALVMDAIRQESGKDLADGVGQIAMGTFLFNPIPQFVKPIAEIYFNKDMFTGRDIETIADKRRPSGERADEATSEVAKMIGEYTGMSPKKTDVLLRGYLGTLATTFTAVADGIFAAAGNRPQGYFGDPTSAASIAANAIGLSRFVKSEEQLGNKFVADFYQMKQDMTEIVTSMKDSGEAQDIEVLKEKLAKNPQAQGLYQVLNRAESQITTINNNMKAIRNNPSLKPDEKVARLQALRETKNRLAEQAVTLGKQFGY